MINTKNIFWEALILTVAIFVVGLFLGIAYESQKLNDINNYYALSEISLVDSLAISQISKTNQNCEDIIESSLIFADRIYSEAILLEKYEDSGKLTDSLQIAHKRYDLLRTMLWINFMNLPEECKNNVSSVVYLYEYNSNDLIKKAENQVWSRVLFDLKKSSGKNIILIPISVDSNLTSLNTLIKRFEINEFPVVIVDENKLISDIKTVEEIKKYLK